MSSGEPVGEPLFLQVAGRQVDGNFQQITEFVPVPAALQEPRAGSTRQGRTRSLASTNGINSAGATLPRTGECHRHRASTSRSDPVLRCTLG